MKTFFDSELMLSSSLNFVILSLVLTVIFHVPIWCGLNLSKRKWKRIDYLWPLLAGVGMLGAVSEIKAKTALGWQETEQVRAVSVLESIHQFSLDKLRSDICMGQVAIDDGVAYHQACSWYLETAMKFKNVDFAKLPESSLFYAEAPNLEYIQGDKAWLNGMFQQYEARKAQYQKTVQAQLKQPHEELLWFISPYLVCFAIALRLTKVTAELRLEKQT
ncbi:TPA: hypothetical protein NJ905_004457 [Vibrio parahaemolyticus]|nr:hypothetical protein [Vibrio parahaemolyticus]